MPARCMPAVYMLDDNANAIQKSWFLDIPFAVASDDAHNVSVVYKAVGIYIPWYPVRGWKQIFFS